MKGALAWPFLRLYFLALLYFSGNSILNVIIPLKGEAEGAASTQIGLIMGAYMFTAMLFRPWAGHFITKYGSIRILRVILVVNGIALIAYPFIGLGGFAAARIMQGVSTAFFSMALQIGIIDALPEKDRSQGISMYSLFCYIPGIMGPLAALGIWRGGEPGYFAWTMIGIALATGIFGYTIKLDQAPQEARQHEKTTERQNFKSLLLNPFLLKCSLLMIAASVVFGAMTTFMPLYAMNVPEANAGVYLMLQAAALVVVRFAWKERMPSDGKWHSLFLGVALLLLTVGAAMVAAAAEWGPIPLYTGAIVIGTSQALIYPTLMSYLSVMLTGPGRNMRIGLFAATSDLGISLGGVLMGPIADLTSFSIMYATCTVLAAAAAGYAWKAPVRRRTVSEEVGLERK
ncbi:MFS transporter [Saccharibacillus sp. O23]|nr:MFS transporter [Saccharibacillus sp. O23]